MTSRERMRSLAIALLVASSAACIGPRAPSRRVPYAVRLLGASDGALRGATRDGRSVFTGSPGRDYAIEVTNDTPSDVGLSIVIDGLDAKTGAPVRSCEGLGGWLVLADGTSIIRGFSVSATRIATYRFAPRDRSLAAITKGGRRESIGTIEVCFFSLRPTSRPVGEHSPTTFGGIVESSPAPTPIVAELRDDPARETAEVEDDKLLSHIIVSYEDEDGRPLGTAPPPAGIARIAPDEPAVPNDPEPFDGAAPPKTTKPPKGTTKPPKPPKGTTKAPHPQKGEKGDK